MGMKLLSVMLLSFTCLGNAQKEWTAKEDPRCPTWMKPTAGLNGTKICVCGDPIGAVVSCDQKLDSARLLLGYCMTNNDWENGSAVAGRCPFIYHKPDYDQLYVTLPQNVSELNAFMCEGLNRTGLLCSQCEPGLGPAVFSYTHQCLECLDSGYGWLLYIFVATFPTTVLFFFIVFFQVRILTSAPMNAFIFVCQVGINQVNVSPHTTASPALYYLELIFITLGGVWNLDFFRYIIPPFCVSNTLTGLQAASLEYIVAFYPLVLIIITYCCVELHDKGYRVLVCLSRPLRICTSCLRGRWNPKMSLIHAFAAFLLLSYSKILVVSYSLLSPNILYRSSGKVNGQEVVYFDSRIRYFSTEHLPFAILAIIVLLLCVALPLLVLLLYPTRAFQKCLGYCSLRWHALHAFVDVFQGCYKNGTAGTSDCRYFAGLYLLWRVIFNVAQLQDVKNFWLIRILVPSTAALLFSFMRPYKDNPFNILDSLAFALLGLSEFWAMYDTYVSRLAFAVVYISPAMAFIYISLYSTYRVLLWAGVLRRCSCTWIHKLSSRSKDDVSPQRSHDTDSDDNELADRINHPELYQPLLPGTTVGRQDSDEDLDTYHHYENSTMDYGSV